MRLPSGYGSIIKKGGKRRRPFAVRITVGWTDEGNQLYKYLGYLGYFATRKEAISCLDSYNENPYNIDSRSLTFSGIYKKWADWRYISHDEKVPNGYASAYKWCQPIHDKVFIDLRIDNLQKVIDAVKKAGPRKRIYVSSWGCSTSTPFALNCL